MRRLIFHIDVNSAFLSWSAIKLMEQGEGDIRLIPSCVGGDPQKRTSIVAAKSIPAKAYGIQTGEPVSMAFRKCPGIVVVPPDFAWYTECSGRFMEICRQYSDILQKFSIDECFLDMTEQEEAQSNPVGAATALKNQIRDELGFTVNVGIGSNKLLAKMAGEFEKPDKVHIMMAEDISRLMWPLPIEELLFVGKKTAARLRAIGVRTIGELAAMDIPTLQSVFGLKQGQQLYEYSHGIDDSAVEAARREAKSYSVERTMESDLTTYGEAYKMIDGLAEHVAQRVRKDRVRAFCIAVTIRSADFKTRSHQCKLLQATDISGEIADYSRQLFRELWDGVTPLRLLGISLSHIEKEEYEQLTLFPDERREKARQMDAAMDAIQKKYGRDAIRKGGL